MHPFVVLFVAGLPAELAAGGEPQVLMELPGPPQILTDAQDRFYVVRGDVVRRVADEVDQMFQLPGDGSALVQVNRDGLVAGLVSRVDSQCDKQGNCTYYRQHIPSRCTPNGNCTTLDIVKFVDSSKSGNGSRSLGVAISASGEVGFGVSRTTCSGSGKNRRCATTEQWRCGGRACSRNAVRDMQETNLPTPPVARPICESSAVSFAVGSFQMANNGRRIPVEGSSQHVRRCGIDAKGRPHIVFHDPRSETLNHAWLGPSGRAEVLTLDGPESGVENAIAYLPNGETVVFGYAYRNSFNKGLRAAILDAQGQLRSSFWVDRSRDGNPGWGVVAAASSGGRVLVAYRLDGRKGRTTVKLYPSVKALEAAQVAEAEGWESEHRDFFVFGGVGAMYPFWFVTSLSPDAMDDGVPEDRIFDASYDLVSSPITSGRLEARWGDLSFGVMYLRSFFNDQIEDAAGRQASQALDWIMGSVGYDRLLFYHDVRLSVTYGRLRGQFNDDNGFAESRIFDSEYQRYEVTLLNKYRFRYGLVYQTYDFHIPVYVYTAAEGAADYTFAESFTTDVEFHEVAFTLGYSRLDYAAKFENEVYDWFFDFDVGVGLSYADFPGAQPVGDEEVSSTTAFMVLFNAEVGYMLYRRFYSLQGFGLYARFAYRAQGDFTGNAGRPEPREQDETTSTDIVARYNRFMVRHGPFIDVGIVF